MQHIHNTLISLRILVSERHKRLTGYAERKKSKQQYRNRIGQTVTHHRAEYRSELGILTLGYVTRTPYFTKTRSKQIYGISAEYTPHKRRQRSMYIESIKLYAPSHSPEYVGKHTDYESHTYPLVIAVVYGRFHRRDVDLRI